MLEVVKQQIERFGPLAAFQQLIAANDALILGADLDKGREIAAARCAIYRDMIAHWAAEQRAAFGYDRPFAVVALGGTGRDEMTPCSDTDFAFLFDDVIEGNPFLDELQRQMLHSGEFRERYGFASTISAFNLDHMPELEGKQLNAFLDMRPAYDPDGLEGRFRERIQATFDPFEHFLHVSRLWRDHWGESVAEFERLDRFDIKNEGLRIFLAGVWTLAGKDFRHSHEIYNGLEDQQALDAYGFLLRIRSFVHLRRDAEPQPVALGDHAEDVLGFEDFTAFGELLGPGASDRQRFEFANEVRERLVTARRRLDRFTWGVIGRELKLGRALGPDSSIAYGSGGLRDTAKREPADHREKSRKALGMLLAAQRYELPIDPAEMETTFRGAGEWLEPVPELAALFYETRGSLARSFEFLSHLPGAQDRLFPGYGKFETSLDQRVMTERQSLRGALLRQKIRALEADLEEGRRLLNEARDPGELAAAACEVAIPVEAALLDANHLAAVKLALITKRLPETPGDVAAREDETRPLHERFSSGLSGIPLDEYYERFFAACGFTAVTLEVTRFLVANRRIFKEIADQDLMDARQVKQLVEHCDRDESKLRALFVFTCADRTEWESEAEEPARWFSIRELYSKARLDFQEDLDSMERLSLDGFSRDQAEILGDFGKDFFDGIYRHYAPRFGAHLLGLKEGVTARPKVSRIRIGLSEIVAVAALDQPGLAASISGAFWKEQVALRQAHLFSAKQHGLALDFFHLDPAAALPGPELDRAIEEAIVEHLYIGAEDEADLPGGASNVTLEAAAADLYRLRAEIASSANTGAIVYALSCRAFRRLGGNIHGLAAHTGKDHAWVSVYLRLPVETSLEQAREIVANWS